MVPVYKHVQYDRSLTTYLFIVTPQKLLYFAVFQNKSDCRWPKKQPFTGFNLSFKSCCTIQAVQKINLDLTHHKTLLHEGLKEPQGTKFCIIHTVAI